MMAKRVGKVKNRILKLLPNADHIEVSVSGNNQNGFDSVIQAHVPPKKEIVVHKHSSSPLFALEKAQNAALKQIKRLKAKPRLERAA